MNRGTELTASAVAERIIGGGEVTAEELVELLQDDSIHYLVTDANTAIMLNPFYSGISGKYICLCICFYFLNGSRYVSCCTDDQCFCVRLDELFNLIKLAVT